MDDDGFIVAAKLTKSSEDDPSTVPCLLEQVDSPIRRFNLKTVGYIYVAAVLGFIFYNRYRGELPLDPKKQTASRSF